MFSELCHLAADSAAYEAGVAEQERNVCDLLTLSVPGDAL